MPVGLSNPVPINGDVRVIKSGSGTLSAGAAAYVAVDSCTLPGVSAGQYLILQYTVTRTGAENIGLSINAVDSTYDANAPGAQEGNLSTVKSLSFIFPQNGSTTTCEYFCLKQRDIDEFYTGGSNGSFGDFSAQKTIYFNIQRRAASTFAWKWTLSLVGANVKS